MRGKRRVGAGTMASKSDQLAAALQSLRKAAAVEGSALLSRDGIPVVADLPKPFSRETFSAMAAAMVGAAETALIEVGRDVPDRIVLEGRATRMVAVGVTNELILIVVGRPEAPPDAWSKEIAAAVQKIRTLAG